MAGLVCHLTRRAGGTVLVRARLVGPGVDRVWAADDTPGGGGATAGESGTALRSVQSAAAWLVSAMDAAGEKRLAALCVDVDGSSCSWLTTFGSSPSVVHAALTQAATHAEGDGSSLVGAAAAAMLVKSETSVQALAVSSKPSPGAVDRLTLSKPGKKSGAATEKSSRQRLAVLAMPDAAVRVLEDELDKAGYEARQTLSLWHALCRSWDPGAPSPNAPLPSDGDAAIDSPSTAVLLIDPESQRLVWAWSRAGRLVAGGVFRLRALPRNTTNGADSTALQVGDSRRFGSTSSRSAMPDQALVVGQAEAGRLVLEWLAWSAELGQSPQRVVCIAPPPGAISVDPLEDPTGLVRHDAAANGSAAHPPSPHSAPASSLAEVLSRAWPGATVDVGHDVDPLGLTLTRLSERVSTHGHGVESEPGDPRYSLTALSARACRADKRKVTWTAAALFVSTVLVAALGWRIGRAASGAQETVTKAMTDQKALLAELEPLMPNLSREPDAMGRISSETALLRRGMEDVDSGYPIFAEVLRVVEALEGAEKVKVDVLSISTVGSVRLTVPDSEIGPKIFDKLKALPGQMMWTFASPPPRNANEPRRVNFNGQWPEKRGTSSAAATSSGEVAGVNP